MMGDGRSCGACCTSDDFRVKFGGGRRRPGVSDRGSRRQRPAATVAKQGLEPRADGMPAEVHVYNGGGHGIGRNRPMPITSRRARLRDRLIDRGLLPFSQ
jgi:hypothetical protein